MSIYDIGLYDYKQQKKSTVVVDFVNSCIML